MPSVTLSDAKKAVKVAEAFFKGDLDILEVPFRAVGASKAIKKIREEMPYFKVGAGTILSIDQLHEAIEAGAQFGLAPGFNLSIVKEAFRLNFPFIPGVMTPSEIELALEHHCKILKLFPSAQMGGIQILNALAGPYAHTGVKFIPMGGVNFQNLKQFVHHKLVIAVGGSWLASTNLISENNFEKITLNVAEAFEAIAD